MKIWLLVGYVVFIPSYHIYIKPQTQLKSAWLNSIRLLLLQCSSARVPRSRDLAKALQLGAYHPLSEDWKRTKRSHWHPSTASRVWLSLHLPQFCQAAIMGPSGREWWTTLEAARIEQANSVPSRLKTGISLDAWIHLNPLEPLEPMLLQFLHLPWKKSCKSISRIQQISHIYIYYNYEKFSGFASRTKIVSKWRYTQLDKLEELLK